MAVFNTSQAPNPTVNIGGVSTPTIQNISLAVANTEYSVTLPLLTAKFRIQVRGTSKIKFSFTAGQSGSNYISVWPGAYYQEEGIDTSSLVIYVQSSQGGETLEVLSWV